MKISFIIPVLNEEKILERSITSLRAFTALPSEVIVSDGGSTDGTLAIAHRFADQVVEWREPRRQNIAMGRNAGARVATGDLFVFVDADVFVLNMNDFFTRAVARFKADPKLAGLIPRLEVLESERTYADAFWMGFFNLFNRFMNNVLRSPAAPGEFQMISVWAFNAVSGYNEQIIALEDMDMFMRLRRIGKTRLDPNLTVYHTGRRAHKVGWLNLWWQWTSNAVMVKFFRRSVSTEWKVIR